MTLISKLIPQVSGSALEELDRLYRARQPLVRRYAGEVEQEVRAMRARYEHADGRETTIAAPLLDDAEAERLRSRLVACRRRLEEIGDSLRELNSTVVIEVNDVGDARTKVWE